MNGSICKSSMKRLFFCDPDVVPRVPDAGYVTLFQWFSRGRRPVSNVVSNLVSKRVSNLVSSGFPAGFQRQRFERNETP